MTDPSDKHPAISNLLEDLFGRSTAIQSNRCVPSPIGCGRKIYGPGDFRNEVSRREYAISGLCQSCQDEVFGGEKEEE